MNDTLTIKKTGDGFCTLMDQKNLSITYNGKEMGDIQSLKINMELEEVIRVEVVILDANLDLENMPVYVEVDELHARILLKKILGTEGVKLTPDQIEQAREMTRGMPDIVDVTSRSSGGFRQKMKTSNVESKKND